MYALSFSRFVNQCFARNTPIKWFSLLTGTRNDGALLQRGYTALMFASKNGHDVAVELLLHYNARVDLHAHVSRSINQASRKSNKIKHTATSKYDKLFL